MHKSRRLDPLAASPAGNPRLEPATALPTLEVLEAKKRWTRDDWTSYGLRVLEEGGLGAVRIDEMAKRSGRTRGSFYGYFKNRDELLDAMLTTFEAIRLATTESTHELQRQAGAFTLSGLVDVLTARSQGELVFHANLELAVRLWARIDSRPRAVLKRIDSFRLVSAVAMVEREMPAIGSAAEIAVLFNALFQGRQLLLVDPANAAMSAAFRDALPAFVKLCLDAARQRGADVPTSAGEVDLLRRRRRRSA
jgi:AcrR family transcriptional regulator